MADVDRQRRRNKRKPTDDVDVLAAERLDRGSVRPAETGTGAPDQGRGTVGADACGTAETVDVPGRSYSYSVGNAHDGRGARRV